MNLAACSCVRPQICCSARRSSDKNEDVEMPEDVFGTQLTLRPAETRLFLAGNKYLLPGTVTFRNAMWRRSSLVAKHAFTTAQDGWDCDDLRDGSSMSTPVCMRGVTSGSMTSTAPFTQHRPRRGTAYST